MVRKVAVGFGLILVAGLLLGLMGDLASEVAGRLLFGWWSFLARVSPRLTVAWDGVATALACLVLLSIGLHGFLRWLYRESRAQGEGPGGGGGRWSPQGEGPGGGGGRWSPRWTVAIVAGTLVMFVAGIAAAGIVHQAGWLLRSRRPWTAPRFRPRWSGNSRLSPIRLREIGLTVLNYSSVRGSLPSWRLDHRGRPLHSWMTAIRPYTTESLDLGEIDRDLPWDDPRNSAYFRGFMFTYLNPEVGPTRDARGYALSHYAGNVHLLGREGPVRVEDIGQGAGNVILAGEVAEGFQAWGDPTNLRDPARGINRGAGSLGGPSGAGANLLFLDGSVRFFGRTTDPKVLEAMGRPRPPR